MPRRQFPLLPVLEALSRHPALTAALAGLLAYLPSLGSGFVNWDDEDYVRDNLYLRAINGRFLAWAFTEFYAANWYPLTWLSHALDHALWGNGPFGPHLVNVVLHAGNCALVAALVRVWLERTAPALAVDANRRQAALVAGLAFALHPIHVEAVAWISQRKELLCSLFYLAGLLFYLRPATGRGKAGGYGASLACHALALMAKPMAVSFPLVLCLLDLHPLRRCGSSVQALARLLEKLPFFALSLGAAWLAIKAQGGGGALASMEELPLGDRLYSACLALLHYGADLIWPLNLAPLYPYPQVPPLASVAYLAPVAAVGLGLAALLVLARRRPGLAVALAALLVALLPVLGLVQVGGQARADRYLYLPGVAAFGLMGVAAAAALQRAKATTAALLMAAGAVLWGLTFAQQGHWRDGERLWSREIAVYPEYAPGYTYRGHALGQTGREDAAIRDFERAAQLPPPSPEPLYYLGELRLRQGRPFEALPLLASAIAQTSWPDARFHTELARAYAALGSFDSALKAVETALRLDPAQARAVALRACVLAQAGRLAQARAAFDGLRDALPALPPDLLALGAALQDGDAAMDAPNSRLAPLCAARYQGPPS